MDTRGNQQSDRADSGEIPLDALERQLLREQTIGFRTVERYKSARAQRDNTRARHIQHLLEEAILSLLVEDVDERTRRRVTVGDLRHRLRVSKLEPVREALRRLSAAKRGQPSSFKRFWSLLDLPLADGEGEEFDRLAELVFFTTLHEMLISVFSMQDFHKDSTNVQDDPSHEAAPTDEPASGSPDGVNSWPWMPERQLYQRVWQAFLLNMVSGIAEGTIRPPRWLKVESDTSLDVESVFNQLEERLEQAFLRGEANLAYRKRPASNVPVALKAPATSLGKQLFQNETETAQFEPTPKPYTELAEEFCAVMVQLVGELTSEDAFIWFQRKRPPDDGRGMASWVPTQTLVAKIQKLPAIRTALSIPVNAPLIVPPKPWRVESLHCGGYYRRRLPFYKFHQKNTRIREFLGACANPELQPALDAVNQIQNTPYRLNTRVWNVAEAMLERVSALKTVRDPSGGSTSKLDAWLKENFAPTTLSEGDETGEQKAGDRIRSGLTNSLVRNLVPNPDNEQELFYFAHQADTRGRLYAVSQWLSPQGEDLSRALLEFGRGKPITESGVQSLAMHGSQLIRFESILSDLQIEEERPPTLQERRRWIDLQQSRILSIAADPLTSLEWTEAKSPFQFLAFCFVWADLVRIGPQAISHLPVHVDGVCNGLQHIAALTGDPALSSATNLTKGMPQDIYLVVMRLAVQTLEARRSVSPYASMALDLRLIDRDLAKSVVMIIPYGAGERGYTKAVRSRMRSKLFKTQKSFAEPTELGQSFLLAIARSYPIDAELPNEPGKKGQQPISAHLSSLAETVAGAFAEALATNFPAIETFKRTLLSSASVVWDQGIPMVWQSPSGLLVMQRSFKESKNVVDCRITAATFGTLNLGQSSHKEKLSRIKFTTTRLSEEVDEREQASSLIPNFIHSLDSAHLIRTVQRAADQGLVDFSVVHDSFGTHAADIPLLARCIREAFLDLYMGKVSPLARFEQWCAVLGIAARAPHIAVQAFAPHIALTKGEQELYGLVARWAGGDSSLGMAMQLEAAAMIERLAPTGTGEIKSKALSRILLFAADRIELEWPLSLEPKDLTSVLASEYFFA